MEVTPEIAMEMLSNNPINRRIKPGRINTLVHEIQSGQWTPSPTPISFSSSGRLLDGQHRLNAIVRAGRPLVMAIAYDVPEDTVFDKGLERESGDALYMRRMIDKDVSSRRVTAVVNRYMSICGNKYLSDTDRANFINQNRENILLALEISKTGVNHAICDKAGAQTGIFAALNKGVEPETLRSFAKCANTGFMESPTESSAIILRNYIFENPQSGQSASEKLAAYTQMCIRDYVSNVARRRKYSDPKHIYINS